MPKLLSLFYAAIFHSIFCFLFMLNFLCSGFLSHLHVYLPKYKYKLLYVFMLYD